MRIAIDMSIAQINQAGTGIYAASLARALQKTDTDNHYRFFSVNQQRDMSSRKSLLTRLDTLYRDLIWTHVQLPLQVAKHGVDLLHMPANVIPLIQPCRTVVTILDAIVLQFPESFSLWHRTYARLLIPYSAKRSTRILTISEQSKRSLVEYMKIDPEKIVVTYLAAASDFGPVAQPEITRVRQMYNLNQYILTVGALEPRKNMIRLLQAFAQLRADGYSGELVHAGPKGWLFEDVMVEVDRLDLQGSVRFLGRVPKQDLIGLYNAATCFVYPSLYEGFGLPVLEAMSCGCPVITSNLSSLPEITGDAAIMVDPYNVQQIVKAMQEVLANPSFAHNLIQRGFQQAMQFSWARCAQETLAVYQQASNG
jgi:glycosyltransferase involved in cell wall biosynthesis